MTEQDVRELLHRAAELAPTELDRSPVPQAVRGRRRTGWALAAAATAVVALAVPAVVPDVSGGGQDRLAGQPEPATSVTVSVSATDLAPLEVSTGPVVPGEQSWQTHELVLTNTGDRPVYVDDADFSQLLTGAQLLVGLGCGYGVVEGRATGGCSGGFDPLEIGPGRSSVLTADLWRDLPGMARLRDGEHRITFALRQRTTTPFTGGADAADAVTSEVLLRYDVRDADADASGRAAAGEEVRADRYLGVWRRPDGTPAEAGAGRERTFELASRRMPEHCDWESAVVLQVPWPLGSTYAIVPDAVPVRHYTRDVEGVVSAFPGAFRSELDLDATLPAGSRPTGYAVNDVELWFGPDAGEEFAYLVRPEGVERWPREFEAVLCA